MEALELSEKTFSARLSHLDGCLDLISKVQRLHALQASVYPPDRDQLEVFTRDTLEAFLRADVECLPVLYRGIYAGAYSAFEAFFSECVFCVVRSLPLRFARFSSMPLGIRNEIDRTISRALHTLSAGKSIRGLERNSLVKSFGTCYDHDGGYEIYADAHMKFIDMVSSKVILETLGRLGIDLNWDDVARNQSILDFFGAKKARECSKLLVVFLDEVVVKRNAVVHIETAEVAITDDDARKVIEFYRLFVPALTSEIGRI